MIALIQSKILSKIKKDGKRGTSIKELRFLLKKYNKNEFQRFMLDLKSQGKVIKVKGRFYTPESLGLYSAKIVKNCKKFCFAQRLFDDAKIFVPGKFSKGAMLGDMVFISPLVSLKNFENQSEEGAIQSIYYKNDYHFTGVLVREYGRFYIKPDTLSKDLMEIDQNSVGFAKEGDKVIAHVLKRGKKHSMHICEVLDNYGSAQKASVCAYAILKSSGAKIEFPATIYQNAERISKRQISDAARAVRLDLTDKPIFTIDSEESKDLDDAVSIEKSDRCYHVGVHIADVAHYVKFKSPIDIEAYERGTSIYYANHVIPMLPPPLSNGICSLNPNVERLTFSALIDVGFDGKIIDFDFKKTIIRSRVKGVYKEVNEILEGNPSSELLKKYDEVLKSIYLMKELYDILKFNKINRGSPQILTTESKIIVDENQFAVDVQKRVQGLSEGIIEEFMLIANEAAATLGKEAKLPFVYRIHEYPSAEKISALKELLEKLGLNSKEIKPKLRPKVMANLIEKTRGSDLFPIVNMQVLRSMAKARYESKPIGHYGLVIENYAHFTSPIRRYSDLTVHRILTDFISHKDSTEILQKRYGKFVVSSSKQATETEKRAMMIERDATDCYKAEYMKNRIGEEFDGIITSIISRGMFITLPNTIEGYVNVESLNGYYEYDGYTKLRNLQSGHNYSIGQKIKVVCISSDVNSGKIEFAVE